MKIGVSFSGGGARAIAHVGVVQALNENGIKPTEVAGTSGGAIIAALYAAGVSVEEMMALASEASILKIFKAGIPIKGLTDLKYLEDLIAAKIPHDDFNQLKTPLSVIATDLITGTKKNINYGSLKKAVVASCSIPILFKPVEINGGILVDGGILDNMPIETLQEFCDFIIGVNIMPNVKSIQEEVGNMMSIGMRVFEIAISGNTSTNIPFCDHLIEPKEIVEYSIFDFGAYEALYKLGYDAAIKEIPKILALMNNC